MGSVPRSTDGAEGLNYQMRDELVEVECGRVREGQDLLEESGSRSNTSAGNINHGVNEVVQGSVNIGQQHPQVSVVCWERYLPRRSLKVLLVENDDSTRHLVSALLRKCGYEVTAATDGLQAWNILLDLTNHIDLVLTEVDMPYLSGIGLLCKIMSHKICKNIPVIMMSSYDPMVLVLKCLSKGAVDFLVKPVRKNELKILWQHVWRKCHSSSVSDSGSESGIHMQKSGKGKNAEESVNNTGYSNGNESFDLNVRDGSDNDSGIQSSWAKQAIEVDNSTSMSTYSIIPPDSTCAQVIHQRNETLRNDRMTKVVTQFPEQDEKFKAKITMAEDLEIGAPRVQERRHEYEHEKVCCVQTCVKHDKLCAIEPVNETEQLEKELLEIQSEDHMGEPKEQAANFIGLVTYGVQPLEQNLLTEGKKLRYDFNHVNSRELDLKRPQEDGDEGASGNDGRNVLTHTDISKFSRDVSTSNHVSSGKVGSCTAIHYSSGVVEKESMNKLFFCLDRNVPGEQWKGNRNINDTGSVTGNVLNRLVSSQVQSASTPKSPNKSSPFHSIHNNRTSQSREIIPQMPIDARREKQQVQVQHHHHHHHYYHHHMHEMQEEQSSPYDGDMQLENMAKFAKQCGSSNVITRSIEGSGVKYSSNGSGSGSKHGSNVQTGSKADVNVGENDMKSENMVPGKSRDCFGSGSVNKRKIGTIHGTSEALNRSVQKRKEKCFKKKVDPKSGIS